MDKELDVIPEPTIDWLIDEIAPNPGNSPLLNFNKKRLKNAIIKKQVEEARRIKNLVDKIPPRFVNYKEPEKTMWSHGYNDSIYEYKSFMKKYIAELQKGLV